MLTGILSSRRFLLGALAGLFGSEAIEDALTPSSSEPQQSTFSRVAIAIATGVIVALFIEYLKKRKII